MPPTPLGQRIATLRRARGMDQNELALTAGLSLSMLQKIERGARQPSDDTLHTLAAALRTTVDHILDGPGHGDSRVHQTIPAIRAAITSYDDTYATTTTPIGDLRARTQRAVQDRVNARYVTATDGLPELLASLQAALHHAADPRPIARLLASAYRTADAIAYKHGHVDLAARCAELMRWAAEQAGDPALTMAAAYVRTEQHFAAGTLAAGLRALQKAIDATPAPTALPVRASVAALHMRAAVVAARMGDAHTAHTHLADAGQLATDVPEQLYHGTAVGPDSLQIHRTAVACELGDPAGLQQAVAAAGEWAPPRTLPSERRSHYYIDLARAQMKLGQRTHALESLQVARRIAPQHVREHGQVRTELATLLRLSRGRNPQLVAFCQWARVI